MQVEVDDDASIMGSSSFGERVGSFLVVSVALERSSFSSVSESASNNLGGLPSVLGLLFLGAWRLSFIKLKDSTCKESLLCSKWDKRLEVFPPNSRVSLHNMHRQNRVSSTTTSSK